MRLFSVSFWNKIICVLCVVFATATSVSAQDNATQLALARQFSIAQEYDKSLPIFEALYNKAPFDKSLYTEYFHDIIAAKKWDLALGVVQKMQEIRRGDLTLLVDKAFVLTALNKKKEAEEVYNVLLDNASRDAYQLKLVADLLQKRNQIDKAIQLYELTGKYGLDTRVYAQDLALLYNAKGDKAKALAATLDLAETNQVKLEDLKNALLAIVGEEEKLRNQLDKELKSRLNAQTNSLMVELWMWHNFSRNMGAQAIEEVRKMDDKNGTQGYLLWQFSIILMQNEHYQEALDALKMAEKNNTSNSFAKEILTQRVLVGYKLVQHVKPFNKDIANKLKKDYELLFQNFPAYATTQLYLDYVSLLAIGFHQLDSAIVLLSNVIAHPHTPKDIRSKAKLDKADYYLMQGEQWESTLLYAQVDKEHKEDALGELAKFKNAQLSYYTGDFEWAQQQLQVLKTASSDMIANDALYLSVLLTENTPLDNDYTSLKQFASADFLIYQNKIQDAIHIVDTILALQPESPLKDDILMMKAKIAIEEGQFSQAVLLLEDIYTHHKDDVLADDALWKLAHIYEDHLEEKTQALKYYELIIIEFPSSTYVQDARQKYNELQKKSKA